MSIRTYGLNSPEFYEAMCRPEERPWIPNGALPREPKNPRGSRLWVHAEDEEAADGAARAWLRHVEAGRIGRRR